MCGFVGFVSKQKKEDKKKIVKDMADAIIHRGPDSDGYYYDDSIALGFRRLSIIDLKGGNQPIYNEDNTKVIVFNGEIYNYKELKEELLKKGHTFKTNTDTEVILHGYEEYKEDLVNYFVHRDLGSSPARCMCDDRQQSCRADLVGSQQL